MPKVKAKRKSGSEEVSVVKKSRTVTVERRYGKMVAVFSVQNDLANIL